MGPPFKEGKPLLNGKAAPQIEATVPEFHRSSGSFRRPNHREWLLSALALFLLCLVTTVERVSFKMLIDRVVPFRFLVMSLVVALEAIILGVVIQCRGGTGTSASGNPFPRHKLLIMAALDLCKDFMLVVSGAFVAPTLTVLLLQGQTPCSMLLSICQNRSERGLTSGTSHNLDYRPMHFVGAGLISLSLLFALSPVLVNWAHSRGAAGSVYNTFVYLLSCIPASASVIYKERALTAYRQPMDPHVLNLYVDIFQLLLLIPFTPLIMRLQTRAFFASVDDDRDDTSSTDSRGFAEGLTCFFAPGLGDNARDPLISGGDIWPSQDNSYCRLALPLLVFYVGSSLLVNFSVDRVLKYGSPPLLYRSVTAATVTAYVVLGVLAHGAPMLNGLSVVMWQVPSAVLLVFGNELYHRYQEPGAEVLTQWAPPSYQSTT